MENELITEQENFNTPWTPRLTPFEFEATKAKVDKINARAEKRGFTGKLELKYNRIEVTKTNEIGLDVTKVFYETTLSGTAPCYNGWLFVARIDVLPNSEEFTLAMAPGVEQVDRSLVKINTCEHCNSKRYRKNIYLVQNVESGEIKNVGSTCIKDFLGWNTSFSFTSVGEAWEELFGNYRYFGEEVFTVNTVLAAAWLAIKEFGWVPASSEDKFPTKGHILNIFDPPKLSNRPSDAEIKYRNQLLSLKALIPEALEAVPAMRDWIGTLDDSSSFNQNLKAAVSVDEVTRKQIGILAFVPEGLARLTRKAAEKEAAAKNPSEFVGEVGEKVVVEGTIKGINYLDSGFGVTTLYTIVTADNNVVKWFASSKALGEDTGREVKIKGTVKKQDVWKDVKSTVLTRCKEVA